MSEIWITSDTHFCHDRAFLYEPRGFHSIDEMNEEIIKRWNSMVGQDDIVYLLGDVMLNDNIKGTECLERLNGHIYIALGNHDTDSRVWNYLAAHNVVDVQLAYRFRYRKYHFYLSHYPTMTGNIEAESLRKVTINLFGHTHSKEKFYNDIPFMYNCALDAHNCYPVNLEQVIEDCRNKVEENRDESF